MRKQTGTRYIQNGKFYLRYNTTVDGQRKKVTVRLAEQSEAFKDWPDVEHLVQRELAKANGQAAPAPNAGTVTDFVENKYLPYVNERWSASTAYSYKILWTRWKDHVGYVALDALKTADVSRVLTAYARDGKSSRSLSHIKWFLSGVFNHAIAEGLAGQNPVPAAKWLHKVQRVQKPPEYSLEQVLAMLEVLEPIDIRAAVAVALAYFAALRPAEICGLRWEDYDGEEIRVRRSIWKRHVGETKTEGSANSVPVIEPLRGLLERLGELYGRGGYILQNTKHGAVDLNDLNSRTIAPALKKAGIAWNGYYPGRRGISSLVTDTSKNALNSTGLLRHSTPVTALKHYTRAQKESIRKALEQVEELATK